MGNLKLFLLILSTMTALISAGGCNKSGGSQADSADVVDDVVVKIPAGASGMGAEAFGDNPLVVRAGTRVTWDNQDNVAHAVKAPGLFDSGALNPGEGAYSYVFGKTGMYSYTAENGMTGTIEVVDSTANDSSR